MFAMEQGQVALRSYEFPRREFSSSFVSDRTEKPPAQGLPQDPLHQLLPLRRLGARGVNVPAQPRRIVLFLAGWPRTASIGPVSRSIASAAG